MSFYVGRLIYMKSKKLSFNLFFLISVFVYTSLSTGCMKKDTVKITKTQIPEWFINSPQDSQNVFYGVGKGRSKEEAKNTALNDIASRISVTIQSTLSSEKEQRISKGEESFISNSQQNLLAQVKAMEFSNYIISDMVIQEGFTYVLVNVDRKALYHKNKKKLDSKMSVLQAKWGRYNTLHAFNRFDEIKQIKSLIDEVQVKLPIITAISDKFKDEEYRKKLEDYLDEMSYLKDRVVAIFQEGNSPEIELVLKKHLSQAGIRLITSMSNLGKKELENLIVINVTSDAVRKKVKTTNQQLKNAHFAKITINLTTRNHNSKVLAKNTFSVTNISQISFDDALLQTSKLDKLVKKTGIISILTGMPST